MAPSRLSLHLSVYVQGKLNVSLHPPHKQKMKASCAYLAADPPEEATRPAVYVVPKGTGMQDPSGGVSLATSEGCVTPVQGWLLVKTEMRNCRGTLLKGVVLEAVRKSST